MDLAANDLGVMINLLQMFYVVRISSTGERFLLVREWPQPHISVAGIVRS
jgi:hypothetical protein